MISRTSINRTIAAALLLTASYLVLSALHVFRGQSWWMEYAVITIASIFLFIGAFLKLRRRTESRRSIISSRDSLRKHEWELRHRREW